MRTRRLVLPALLAAVCLVMGGLAPSSAFAAPLPGVTEPAVVLTVNAKPEPVTKGKKITVKGTVRRDGKGLKKVRTTLEFAADGDEYTKVKTVRSSKKGALKTTVRASRSGRFRYVYPGKGSVADAVSPGDHVEVLPKPKTYKSCAALTKVYPHGVGKSGAHDKGGDVTDFTRDSKTYAKNKNKDKDKDGVACEPVAAGGAPGPVTGIPRPDHVVIVVEENHSYDSVSSQPYLSSLRAGGADMTASHGITHPSQPNYLALWSGSTQGVRDDSCPHSFGTTPSLSSQLGAVTYSESLPSAGYLGCRAGAYALKHNPGANFSAGATASANQPVTAFPSTAAGYEALPRVSLVVPNLDHDMHDGSVATGDQWLHAHLSGYAAWAQTHNSVLIVTFDEDDGTTANTILTVFSGEHVAAGKYAEPITHLNVLHTIERAFGVPQLGDAAAPVERIWK